MGLTKTGKEALSKMQPGYVEDLYNALAGMGTIERNAFVRMMVARAPDPMPKHPTNELSAIEEWWEQKIRTQVMLSIRPEEGWLREMRIDELVDDYIASTKSTCFTHVGNATSMGRFLKKVMPTLRTSSRKMHVEVQAGDADGASYKPNTVNRIKRRVRWYHFVVHDVARGQWLEYLAKRG